MIVSLMKNHKVSMRCSTAIYRILHHKMAHGREQHSLGAREYGVISTVMNASIKIPHDTQEKERLYNVPGTRDKNGLRH